MAFNESRKLKAAKEQMKVAIRKMVVVMGNDALAHFKEGFRKQGFTDETLTPWQPRKRTRYKGKSELNRAILTKTGTLSRSLKKSYRGLDSITISTNVPYAVYHNEGGAFAKRGYSRISTYKLGGLKSRKFTSGDISRKISGKQASLRKLNDSISTTSKLLESHASNLNKTQTKLNNLKGLRGAAPYKKSLREKIKKAKAHRKTAAEFHKSVKLKIRIHEKDLRDLKGKAKSEISLRKKAHTHRRLVRSRGGDIMSKSTVKAHSMNLPKRQFVGHSRKLNAVLISKFNKEVKGVFK